MPFDSPGARAASPDEVSAAAQLKFGEDAGTRPGSFRSVQRYHSKNDLRSSGVGSFRSMGPSEASFKELEGTKSYNDSQGTHPESQWDEEECEAEIAPIVDDPYNMPYETEPIRQYSEGRFGEDQKTSDDAWRRVCYLCSCISCVVILGLSIGLGRATSTKRVEASPIVVTKTAKPSNSPTSAPTASPEDFAWCYGNNETNETSHDYKRYDAIESALISSGVSTGNDFSNETSYQKKSLCWLTYGDRAELAASDPFLAQRYALAAIYYAFDENSKLSNGGWLSGKPECDWEHIVCDRRTNSAVSELRLPSNDLAGTLPKEMRALKYVELLDLSGNDLDGDISKAIEGWVHLKTLILTSNRFGSIPSSFIDWEALEQFEIAGNSIAGTIPDSLASLTRLTYVDLAENQFNGTIPSEFGTMTSLQSFFLHQNELTGSMPEAVCNLISDGKLEHVTADCVTFRVEVECECCTRCEKYDGPRAQFGD